MSIQSELETKIPPPLLGVVTALLMWLLAQLLPSMSIFGTHLFYVGIAVMLIGFSLDMVALGQFLCQKVHFDPTKPQNTNKLVISGLYHYSRNPMYLGLLITLIGWSLFLSNLASFFLIPAFIYVLTVFQIVPEERILGEKFGESYQQYLSQVRRWL